MEGADAVGQSGSCVEHVHAEADVLSGAVASRALMSALLGRCPTTPGTVLTGCGLRRPLAATSSTPEKVTCWACRQHAAAVHERAGRQQQDLVDLLALSPAADGGIMASRRAAAAHHSDLATRYRG